MKVSLKYHSSVFMGEIQEHHQKQVARNGQTSVCGQWVERTDKDHRQRKIRYMLGHSHCEVKLSVILGKHPL